MEGFSRRGFSPGLGWLRRRMRYRLYLRWRQRSSVAVITDEISKDFDHACSVAPLMSSACSGSSFAACGTQEPSGALHRLPEIADAQKILAKYNLRVTDIASPLFKVDWPDAPFSHISHQTGPRDARLPRNLQAAGRSSRTQHQPRSNQFKTDKVRCFDFWRLDDPDAASHRQLT